MDAAGIFEASHAMKGVCGSLDFDALVEEFRAGHERKLTDEEVRGKLGSIEALYRRTVEGIHTCLREE